MGKNLKCDYEVKYYEVEVKCWLKDERRIYKARTEEEFVNIIKGIKRENTLNGAGLEILKACKVERLVDFTEN